MILNQSYSNKFAEPKYHTFKVFWTWATQEQKIESGLQFFDLKSDQ